MHVEGYVLDSRHPHVSGVEVAGQQLVAVWVDLELGAFAPLYDRLCTGAAILTRGYHFVAPGEKHGVFEPPLRAQSGKLLLRERGYIIRLTLQYGER